MRMRRFIIPLLITMNAISPKAYGCSKVFASKDDKTPIVRASVVDDARIALRDILVNAGYDLKGVDESRAVDVFKTFINIKARQLPVWEYTVHFSNELSEKLRSNTLPMERQLAV